MWIQVRTIDGKKTVRVDSLSKLTKIEDLRQRLISLFDAQPSDQRLFFRGKQLEDGHTLFDYDVGLNDLIQLMVRAKPALTPVSTNPPATTSSGDKDSVAPEESSGSDKENKEPDSDSEQVQPSTSQVCLDLDEGNLYKVSDIIDARDPTMGAWFEAKILEVVRDKGSKHGKSQASSSEPEDSAGGSQSQQPSAAGEGCSSKTDSAPGDSGDNTNQGPIENKENSITNTEEISDKCVDSETSEKLEKENTAQSNDNKSDQVESETRENRVSGVKDKNCNEQKLADSETAVPNDKDVPMETDSGCDEVDGCISRARDSVTSGSISAVEDLKKNTVSVVEVLSPRKVHEQENRAGSSKENSTVNRSLFVKESSDELKKLGILRETTVSDGFLYKVVFDGYEDDVVELTSKDIRPRARHVIKFENVKEGQTIMANYNYDEPNTRGFWYDCLVTKKRDTRTMKELYATVYIGADLMPLENCRLLFLTELFEVEKPGTQLTEQDLLLDPTASPAKRQNKPECDHCKDNPRRKCKHCACCVCGGKHDPEKQLMCDECDQAYHLDCLNPPLTAIPDEDEWYCPSCKRDENEVVKAGEKLKESKKKSKMASATGTSNRDWGKGMACVGRTKQCTIVPSNHYGPIPGVEVGTLWKFRVQVSEAGVHRPHVAGIHGREDDGAYSIVLSGGYEDDADDGHQFYYTGSGGRDLSGNKRTAEQSCDQKLTRMNKALAKNCNAPLNDKSGAEAKDWRGGKPVRVVRNCKGRKHSKYAPEEGNRYDGIYKVVKYWAEKGKSGFLVWRYLLRRDDPAPAPWTKEGKKRAEELDLTMQYPEASPAIKEESKRAKKAAFKVDADIMKLIKADKANKKLWDEALAYTSEGKQKFLQQLEEVFMCICCQEILYKPVTLQCSHNFCKPCITRSFKAEVYSCPACRTELPKDISMAVNKELSKVLNHFYPGYEAGRE
ncbi:hypothetical protein BaRGS_00036893 [Batillaria attramentaria]|uniref:RING-type E3 ubiquitin transferase n=1 Tax=Batillaria attramentaria TaxID=370345 RepID=A0ABD0JA82_9CAEN